MDVELFFFSFIPTQVSQEDGYPQQVCGECLDKLTNFRLFKLQCENSHEIFDKEFRGLKEQGDVSLPSDVGGGSTVVKVEPIETANETCVTDATGSVREDVVVKMEALDCDEELAEDSVDLEAVGGELGPSNAAGRGACGGVDETDAGKIRISNVWGGVRSKAAEALVKRLQPIENFPRLQAMLQGDHSYQRSSLEQREIMVAFMERNRGILCKKKKGSRPAEFESRRLLWKKLTAELNAAPYGCQKTWDKWQHSFTDWRNNVRCKAKAIHEGNASSTLTPLELRLLALSDGQDRTPSGDQKDVDETEVSAADESACEVVESLGQTSSQPHSDAVPKPLAGSSSTCEEPNSSSKSQVSSKVHQVVDDGAESPCFPPRSTSRSAVLGDMIISLQSSASSEPSPVVVDPPDPVVLSQPAEKAKSSNASTPRLFSSMDSTSTGPKPTYFVAVPVKPCNAPKPASKASTTPAGAKKRKLECDVDDSFKRATSTAEESLYTSSVSDSPDGYSALSKRVIRRPARYAQESDEDESDATPSREEDENDASPLREGEQRCGGGDTSPEEPLFTSVPVACELGDINSALGTQILRSIAKLTYEVHQLRKEVLGMRGVLKCDCSNGSGIRPMELKTALPLSTEESVASICEEIKDSSCMDELVNVLAVVGGDNLAKCVGNIMRKLITNDLSKVYSACGKKGKKSLAALSIYKAIEHYYEELTLQTKRQQLEEQKLLTVYVHRIAEYTRMSANAAEESAAASLRLVEILERMEPTFLLALMTMIQFMKKGPET